jgi:hypothetical protein
VEKPLTTNRDLFKVITTVHLLRMKSADMDTIELLLPPPSLKRIMKPMFLHLRLMERKYLKLKRDFARRRIEQRHIEAVGRERASQVTRHSAPALEKIHGCLLIHPGKATYSNFDFLEGLDPVTQSTS